jgi:hypothetical protein
MALAIVTSATPHSLQIGDIVTLIAVRIGELSQLSTATVLKLAVAFRHAMDTDYRTANARRAAGESMCAYRSD